MDKCVTISTCRGDATLRGWEGEIEIQLHQGGIIDLIQRNETDKDRVVTIHTSQLRKLVFVLAMQDDLANLNEENDPDV